MSGSFAHSLANAVAEVPGGAVGDAERALHLLGRHSLFGDAHQVDGDEPLTEGQVGVVHDRSGRDGKLVGAAQAVPLVTVGDLTQRGFAASRAADASGPTKLLEVVETAIVGVEAIH